MTLNKNCRIAVIGSGHAAFGACAVLTKHLRFNIDVIDIGLTSPYFGQPEKSIPNAKTYKGSFFPYGLNDLRWPVKLDSLRICSSHAYGGFSNVYSGAFLAPRTEDLIAWPKDSIPLPQDYREVLRHLNVIGAKDELELWSPTVPPCYDSPEISTVATNQDKYVLGYSRIALRKSECGGQYTPFNTADIFSGFRDRNQINYIESSYVHTLLKTSSGVQVLASCGGVEKCLGEYKAVFLAAGCVNSTYIAHRSCKPGSVGQYQILSSGGFIQGFIGKGPNSSPELDLRRKHSLPEMFLEIQSADFLGHWSHTQISAVNRYVLETIAQRLPSVVINKLSQMAERFYFAITSVPSLLNPPSTMVCSPASYSSEKICNDQIHIEEMIPTAELKLRQAVRAAIEINLEQLNISHIPCSEWLGNKLRGNKLGGWHLGGTIPMSSKDDGSFTCTPQGELRSMPGVFMVDSASFPSIPGTTVALLSMAHAAKVARQWVENHFI